MREQRRRRDLSERSGRPLEWATAGSARGGESVSGDLAVVSMLPDGALVAALDGLGHGAEAARAAATAPRWCATARTETSFC